VSACGLSFEVFCTSGDCILVAVWGKFAGSPDPPAAVSLARPLRGDTPGRGEGRGKLEQIFAWFTERFGTADLRTPGRCSMN
jgi:hypothetical protein